MKISIISNIYLEPFVSQSLRKKFTLCKEKLKIEYINYQEFLNNDNNFNINSFDLYIILINQEKIKSLNIKHLYNIVAKIYVKIKNNCNKKVLVFGYENYYDILNNVSGYVYDSGKNIDYVNYKLARLIDTNDSFIDLKHIIAKNGIINAYNITNKYRWDSPYSKELSESISSEIFKQYKIFNGLSKKCIVLDCDNVLWGGILSEDGIENIKLSENGYWSIYNDFQKYVVDLYNKGVIITICSKNNFEDVKNVFDNHKCMILKEKHISIFKVNWNNKVENIKSISEELKISLDSMIFIDDSIEEINQVNNLLPEVKTIHFNIKKYHEYDLELNLKKDYDLKIINNRTRNYKCNLLREKLKESSHDQDEYVMKLNVEVDIKKATLDELLRISELSQRTNKITNGKRLTMSELKELYFDDNYEINSVYVKDRFSNYGLVGSIIFTKGQLILFSMSCRVIGLGVELEMLNFIKKFQNDYSIIFIDTGKNEYIKNLLLNNK